MNTARRAGYESLIWAIVLFLQAACIYGLGLWLWVIPFGIALSLLPHTVWGLWVGSNEARWKRHSDAHNEELRQAYLKEHGASAPEWMSGR